MQDSPSTPTEQQTLFIQQTIDLAVQHHTAGRLSEAEQLYQQILQAHPNQPNALHLLGVIAYQVGKNDIAVELITKALAIQPNYAEAQVNLGNALKSLGKLDEAVASFQKALTITPDLPEVHYNLGNTLMEMGRLEPAIDSFRKALAIKSNYIEALENLGSALKENGQLDAAVVSYHEALAIKPNSEQLHYNLGNALRELGKRKEAVESFRKAISIKPDYAEAHYNLGNIFIDLGDPEGAVVSFKKALTHNPGHDNSHSNLGAVLLGLGDHNKAAESIQNALNISPEDARAHYNLGLAQLAMGDFQNGWNNYAWRWKTDEYSSRIRNYKEPLWNGSDLEGKTIFIYGEQGLGDDIQFVRYLPILREYGACVVLHTPEPLYQLFKGSGLADHLVGPKETPPSFDCHLPILDVPRLVNTTLETIPSQKSYLQVTPKLQEEWANRISSNCNFRVGVVWAGSSQHQNDLNRSIEASLFQPFTNIPGVSVYSLQVGRDGEAVSAFGDNVTDLATSFSDFADTAAAINNLDLIISVDTSVAHLAGALGRPVWTLLPFASDWRWLLERDDSPWYPSMRLFRQEKRGDWKRTIERVCEALTSELEKRKLNSP